MEDFFKRLTDETNKLLSTAGNKKNQKQIKSFADIIMKIADLSVEQQKQGLKLIKNILNTAQEFEKETESEEKSNGNSTK